MDQPQSVRNASHLYEVERRAEHAARPGFRITELQLSSTQKVPWGAIRQRGGELVLAGLAALFVAPVLLLRVLQAIAGRMSPILSTFWKAT